MKDSYCGFCDHCQLSGPDLQEALVKVKTYLDRLPAYWQQQCYLEGQDFSLGEFRRGLDWFMGLIQCPGCKDFGGLGRCTIRSCAVERRQEHCYECPDLDACEHLFFI